MNCISLCQRADYVLNVGRMDTPHIQTHYDDKQTHLWIIIKTHVGSFKRDIHTYRHIMGTLSRHTRGQSKETDISTTHVSVMPRSAGGTQQTHTPPSPQHKDVRYRCTIHCLTAMSQVVYIWRQPLNGRQWQEMARDSAPPQPPIDM